MRSVAGMLCILLSFAVLPGIAQADQGSARRPEHKAFYARTNLVSDIDGIALNTDPNLINPWGLAASPTGPFWVANNGSGTSTLYDGDGNQAALVVSIPGPGGGGGPVTGQVFNGTPDFVIGTGGKSGPARFLFSAEDGSITGWSPAVNQTSAFVAVDNSASGAVYKGLAMANTPSGNRLYATDFHNAKVDVFDSHFQPVTVPGGFTDPNLPAGYAPFGVANIGGSLIVTYAMQDEDGEDDVSGAGLGVVDAFDTAGHLMRRFATAGPLNAPWGITMAPRGFGRFGGTLLIGDFGDGRINAFDPRTGAFLGALSDFRNRPIAINGLWALAFGNGKASDAGALYFTAGIADEEHGLFGRIDSER